ncbi:MAG TPA: FkbM family methyltransferase [Saprospiraceae bacterium]|nr:FkbM family methyltransferase [Saprospiraceae bacterium]
MIKNKIKYLIKKLYFIVEENPLQAARVDKWYKMDQDNTLRYSYDIDTNSLVFDVGGYKGEWAEKIFNKYHCYIYIFEPVKSFYNEICLKFAKNEKIKVFNFGLSHHSQKLMISINDDKSSIFSKSGTPQEIEMVDISEFLSKNQINKIDLLKLNIEGGEYDVIDKLTSLGWIINIRDLQVQFHDFVEDSDIRLSKIRRNLESTHYLTYCCDYVWENWRIKPHL